MSADSPVAFEAMLDTIELIVEELREDYEAAYMRGHGGRSSGWDGGKRRGQAMPTEATVAAGSQARGKCRRATRLVRQAIDEGEEKVVDGRVRVVNRGPLRRALDALGEALGHDDPAGTSTPRERANLSPAELEESLRRQQRRREQPMIGETKWGAA